jgi:hypothetical protein
MSEQQAPTVDEILKTMRINEYSYSEIVTDIPEDEVSTLDVDPCEISDEFCEYVAKVKDEFKKRTRRKNERIIYEFIYP